MPDAGLRHDFVSFRKPINKDFDINLVNVES